MRRRVPNFPTTDSPYYPKPFSQNERLEHLFLSTRPDQARIDDESGGIMTKRKRPEGKAISKFTFSAASNASLKTLYRS